MTKYEMFGQMVKALREQGTPENHNAMATAYIGLAAGYLAKIVDVLEEKNDAAVAEYNRGKIEGLEEAMRCMSNMGFCQTSDYYHGIGDAIKICKDIQKEIKGAENAAD